MSAKADRDTIERLEAKLAEANDEVERWKVRMDKECCRLEAEVERLREVLREIVGEPDISKAQGIAHDVLRGGGEPKAHADDCPCVMCDPTQVRLDQQLRDLRGGGE